MVNIPSLYEGSDTQYQQFKLEILYAALLKEMGESAVLMVPDSSNDQKVTFITRKKHSKGLNATFTWDSAPTLTHEGIMPVWKFDGSATGADSPNNIYWTRARDTVTNGLFGSDSDWTKNSWTISGGVAVSAGAQSTTLSQTPFFPLVEGNDYVVTYTVTRDAGSVTASVGTTDGTARSTAATFTETITAGSGTLLEFKASSFTGTIDVVSITNAAQATMSMGGMINYTDATSSVIISKKSDSGSNREWLFRSGGSDKLQLLIFDERESGNPSIDSVANVATVEGIWLHQTATYDGTANASGINLYSNGVVIASTDTDDADFLSMRKEEAVVSLGVRDVGGIDFFNGLMGLLYFTQIQLTAAQIKNIDRLLKAAMGLSN